MKMNYRVALLAIVAGLVTSAVAKDPNTLTKRQKENGWKLLFDGKSFDGWKGFKKDSVGDGWAIEDGAMVWKKSGAGDLLTEDRYKFFDLVLDYKISKGGNSGLMFHVTEDADTPWKTGPEVQIQDNKDGHDPQLAGWLYQLYKPETDATKPAGEWNTLRLRIGRNKGTVWMNGTKYYDFKKGSDEWDARVAKSKFAEMPLFGKPKAGAICLQDHGNVVAFRNIRIKEVGSKKK